MKQSLLLTIAVCAILSTFTITQAQSPAKFHAESIRVACDDCRQFDAKTATVGQFGEMVLADPVVIPAGSFKEYRISSLGGARVLMISIGASASGATNTVRVVAWFGPTGGSWMTPANKSVKGSDSGIIWGNTITTDFSVHGSQCGVRVYNDGLFSVTIDQISAYWAP